MAQEQTDKIISTKKVKLDGGRVRPEASVKFKFTSSKHHPAGTIETIHPSLAKKFLEKGIGELVDKADAKLVDADESGAAKPKKEGGK